MSRLTPSGWSARAIALGATLAILGGCSEPEATGVGTQLNGIIASVSSRDGAVTAAYHTGQAPVGSSGPTATVDGITSVINGGSAAVAVQGASDFQRVYVSVLGAEGYYDLQLPSQASLEDLVLGIAPELNAGRLTVRYTLEGPGGVGAFAEQSVRVIRVGTGDVQISVAWTGASDVDLHVYDPAGDHVYFANKAVASGGQLDLDSNAACTIDGKNNENIVWPVNGAPAGEYQVFLDYWSDCGVERSDWVVTVARKGHAPEVFTGSFVGPTASNPQVLIGSFSY